MYGATTLVCWPTSLDCVSWSQDGILAVAAGETLELLVMTSPDRDRQWENLHLRTNLFNNAEVPIINPLGFRSNSIGEEISTSTTALIAWSPPGLAKHRRCALAVLTTNLVLSLWACDSKPGVAASWKRALVVNHAVEAYFEEPGVDESLSELDRESRRRMKRRIRSFCWSPQIYPSTPSNIEDSQIPVNGCFIAVSNDDNDIVVLRIQSPFDFFSPVASEWSARVVVCFSVQPKISSSQNAPPITLFNEHMEEQRFISNLAWSPWSLSEDGTPQAVLAYTTNEKLLVRRIRIPGLPETSAIDFDKSDIVLEESVGTRDISLLRWAPKISDHLLYLVAFTPAEARCYEMNMNNLSSFKLSNCYLYGRWDSVSGCAISTDDAGQLEVHFAPHLFASKSTVTALKLPIQPLEPRESPLWQNSIRESETVFSAENELGGHVLPKTWGLTSSPMGDLIASAHTLHPGDMVDYTIAAASRTNVGIHQVEDNPEFILPPSDVCAETVLYSAKKWMEASIEDIDEEGLCEVVREQFWKAFGLFSIEDHEGERQEVSPPEASARDPTLHGKRILSQYIKRRVVWDRDCLKERCERLLSLLFPDQVAKPNALRTIWGLVNAVARIPPSYYNDSKSGQKIHSAYLAMLPRLKKFELDDHDSTVEMAAAKHVEQCEICDDIIEFEDFLWARCVQGHQFVRCALTFLAIQAPGISKFCGVCGRQYLDEQHIARNDKLPELSSPAPSQQHAQDIEMPDASAGSKGEIDMDHVC
ncbi:uncharacterized protein K452DRAFT_217535 [Aplosporella prunicola CBS 121167]|uniref:Transcription factor IIIC putative zinc-finger domain-containing protein n=1 Tax=Aplosporella prunicola CBS 121167 TaxID=1176127 RepID=A0A6A6BW08_9PEZI|nr:uncharacterized protein K452DRAFT_217535 [Aplosporella prunicola CBS 121167]KAF2147533.1 hypothetical protein K452DRAFT_217535 [Aplosporella prunicola CBS 121167]